MKNRGNIFLIDHHGIDDPRINLAIEEYVLRHPEPARPYLLLYINRPSVIVGRNQNPLQEVDLSYTGARNILVLRRASGGGAVYHDYGNLNFSFITPYERTDLNNYRKFTAPIIEALKVLGVPAALNIRNDIVVSGKKISGNAQFATGKAILTHGTLLFDAELAAVHQALTPKAEITASKAVRSVRSRVANITEFLSTRMNIDDLQAEIGAAVAGIYGGLQRFRLAEPQWKEVEKAAREKYHSWKWTYGRSPRFSIRRSGQTDAGPVYVRIDVEGGRIKKIDFDDRFFDPGDIRMLKNDLVGSLYRKNEISRAIDELRLERYDENITRQFLVDLLIEE